MPSKWRRTPPGPCPCCPPELAPDKPVGSDRMTRLDRLMFWPDVDAEPAELLGHFQRLLVQRLHRLGRVPAVLAHVFARQPLQLRRLRRPHQELVVEPLHEERNPREPALHPDAFQLREPLGEPVQDPVRHVHHVAPDEPERVHAEDAVRRTMLEFDEASKFIRGELHVARG